MNFLKNFNINKNIEIVDEEDTYTKNEGIGALIFTIIFMILALVNKNIFILLKFRDYYQGINESSFFDFIYIVPYYLLAFIVIIIMLKVQKRGLTTIGLNIKTAPKSFLLGLVVAVPILAYKIIAESLYENMSPEKILWISLYFATYMFVREIVFRGFLQSRIMGLVKNKWISMTIVAALYAFMHFPEFDIEYFIFHFVLVYFFTRQKNIWAPFLLQFAWNIY